VTESFDLQPYDETSEVALKAAADVMAGARFAQIACASSDQAAAFRVTEVADVFVQWLRRLRTVTLTLVAIEEIDTGEIASTPTPGGTVTTIDTSQRARYVISAADDRGFPVDASLTAESSDTAVATVDLLEATSGTASGKDELVVTAVAPGSALVRVFDAVNPDIFGSDSVDVVAGGVAAVVLEAPSVEEQDVVPVP